MRILGRMCPVVTGEPMPSRAWLSKPVWKPSCSCTRMQPTQLSGQSDGMTIYPSFQKMYALDPLHGRRQSSCVHSHIWNPIQAIQHAVTTVLLGSGQSGLNKRNKSVLSIIMKYSLFPAWAWLVLAGAAVCWCNDWLWLASWAALARCPPTPREKLPPPHISNNCTGGTPASC